MSCFSVLPIPSFLDNSSLELGVTFRLRDAKNPVASICADMPVATAAMSNICADMHVATAPCVIMWRLLLWERAHKLWLFKMSSFQ